MPDNREPLNILIIDDDPAIREELRDALEAWGYAVTDAANGREGLKLIKKAVPDIVITDIMMPEMDGIEIVRSLRETHPTLRIIALSGGDSQGYMGYLTAAGRLGADTILTKPIQLAKLLNIISTSGRTGS
jgi:CheY-like chemotaxis protein